jgi:hypothetical protein
VPISGKEFNTPLTFTFPGPEVRDVTVIDGAGDDPDKILVRPRRRGPCSRSRSTDLADISEISAD